MTKKARIVAAAKKKAAIDTVSIPKDVLHEIWESVEAAKHPTVEWSFDTEVMAREALGKVLDQVQSIGFLLFRAEHPSPRMMRNCEDEA